MNENKAVTLMKITFNKNEKHKLWGYSGIAMIDTNKLNKALDSTGKTIQTFCKSGKDLFKDLDLYIEITLDSRLHFNSYLNIEADSKGMKDIMSVAINNQLEMVVENILRYVRKTLRDAWLDYDLNK